MAKGWAFGTAGEDRHNRKHECPEVPVVSLLPTRVVLEASVLIELLSAQIVGMDHNSRMWYFICLTMAHRSLRLGTKKVNGSFFTRRA